MVTEAGYKIVTQNFNCRRGEIDIIALSPDQNLCFIEVRSRKNNAYGDATETVTHSKQQKLICAANDYLMQHPAFQQLPCRFDVIGFTNQHASWIKNAFY